MQKFDIYLDNAATTRCSEESISVITKTLREDYFNPSATYHPSIQMKEKMNGARKEILGLLHGEGSLIFTGGGTESDNLALFGTRKPNGARIIVSAAEHAAVYRSAMELMQRGYDVQFAPVDGEGKVDVQEFAKLLNQETALVSVMHVNNETGAINDIATLNTLIKRYAPKAIFHSDGVQAVGKIPVNLSRIGVDLYSLSAHKLHAPKGLGGLYIKKGIHLKPIVFGGGQEDGLRSSTENTGAILAFGQMAKYYRENGEKTVETVRKMNSMVRDSMKNEDGIRVISSETASPFICTVTSSFVRGEVMQHALEREGIYIGTGSACSSSKASRRITEALGLKGKEADGVMRMSFSEYNTLEECEKFMETFRRIHSELKKYGN